MRPNRPLTELCLEITNACHHRCVHCSTAGGLPRENELTQDDRLRVLREACQLGLVELRLLGGDPLFRLGDTIDLVAEANRLGVKRVLICTSAVEHRLEWLETFSAITPIQISAEASIYSASSSIHDGITLKPRSLERLLENSRQAVRIGFDLNWNFVWMKPNFFELESVVRLASEVGVKRVRILRLMLNGRARENGAALRLPLELEMQCESVLESLAVRFPNVLLVPSKPLAFLLKNDRYNDVASCSAGEGQLVVQADGTVLPCIGMKDMPQFEVGNVRTDSIAELLARTNRVDFPRISQEFFECPAILSQRSPEIIKLTLGRI
ncbi:MAG: radical SAM protein [Terriglobia bacterium]